MKRFFKINNFKIKRHLAEIVSVIALAIVLISVPQYTAHAADSLTSFLGFPKFGDLVVQMIAEFVNLGLQLASWILAISGFLLNFSMSVTLNIKAFVEATPAIYTVWKAIRDISGMMIIFMLLFAAIKMILGQDAKLGELIKTIVVVGVLINFSFFVTGLGIDVSNVVSLQLYNAIAPANQLTGINSLNPHNVESTMRDGGISDIFMQSLQIVKLYNVKTLQLNTNGVKNNGDIFSPALKIILIGFVGIIIILTAAASFFLAALAFIVRFVILLFLLAFSPIWFASQAVPQLLGAYAKKWTDMYKNQLMFMPVYLLLMYFAMSVMTDNKFFGSAYAGDLTTSGAWYANFLTIAVNAVLVILMLNAPLVAALSMGAMIPKKLGESLGAGNIWKKIGLFSGGVAGRGSIGRIGSSLDKRLANTRFGNNSTVRDLRAITTGLAAKSKFGSSRSYEDQAKINEDVTKQRELIKTGNTDMDKKRKSTEKTNELKSIIDSGTTAPNKYQEVIKKMNEKERLALGGKNLKNTEVLKHLKKSDFEAIKKSDDISDEDKAEIGKLRMEALRHTVDQGHSQEEFAEHMLKNMETDDIMKLESSYLQDPYLIKHLTAGQLKKMADEKLDPNVKRSIGSTILNWAGNPISGGNLHHAYGFIDKNRPQWQ